MLFSPKKDKEEISDSYTPAAFGTFPNRAQKIICLKNLKFPKSVSGNKIKKTNSVYATSIILIIWCSGFSHSCWLPHCQAFEQPNGPLVFFCLFNMSIFLNNFYMFHNFFWLTSTDILTWFYIYLPYKSCDNKHGGAVLTESKVLH